ncbi:hypothetical protein C5167_035258 [Papaver somniferum]|uniref:Uncharacterized protein n=1 Tax=Papaver somniferum TaxID=3469 RepID=A0A4Y7KDQ9_PAPSO|nr:uncharacterized protein LOC113293390 [Papaver somniferum]RZC71523.1 hypothetical protein C5167_035258 [Papaver somniferum]
MEEDREFDSVSKQIDFLFNQLQSLKQKAPSFEAKLEEKITKLQHISKDPTVDALNIQEPVDRCIERYQNQLVKIRRVGQLVETKDETDSGERITSFVNIQKLEELERIKSLEDKLKKEEEKVSDLATNLGNCQSTLLELSAKFDQFGEFRFS